MALFLKHHPLKDVTRCFCQTLSFYSSYFPQRIGVTGLINIGLTGKYKNVKFASTYSRGGPIKKSLYDVLEVSPKATASQVCFFLEF